MKAETGNNKRM